MNARRFFSGLSLTCLTCLMGLSAVGCQTSVGGQTLPSAYYLFDDVQYYPAGPDTPLARQRLALEEYQSGREAVQDPDQAP